MSHGRRMLEAQSQKARENAARDDGRVDDGHLRNASRALNDDGTPVRPSNLGRLSTASSATRNHENSNTTTTTALEADNGRSPDALLASPPPRPGVYIGGDDNSSRKRQRRRHSSSTGPTTPSQPSQRPSGGPNPIAISPAGVTLHPPGVMPMSSATQRLVRPSVNAPATSGISPASSARTGVPSITRSSAARHVDVDAATGSSSERDDSQQHVGPVQREGSPTRPPSAHSHSTSTATTASTGGGESWGAETPTRRRRRSRSDIRGSVPSYPVGRVQAHLPPSPPQVQSKGCAMPYSVLVSAQGNVNTVVARSDNGQQDQRDGSPSPPSVTLGRTQLRRTPLPQPGTGSNTPPPPLPSEAVRPSTSFLFSHPTPPLLPLSPASPPLRAGVSPRMLPRHPTRIDPTTGSASTTASVYSLSRATSTSNMTPATVNGPSGGVTPSAGAGSVSSPPSSQQHPLSQPAQGFLQERLVSTPLHSRTTPPSPTPPAAGTTIRSGADVLPSMLVRAETTTMNGNTNYASASLLRSSAAEIVQSAPSPTASQPTARSPPLSPLPPSLHVDRLPSPAAPLSPPLQFTQPPQEFPSVIADVNPQLRDPVWDFRRSPLTYGADLRRYPRLRDCSGLHNAGNDCYGCSALTMLLRSMVFRRALLNSPLMVALQLYESVAASRPVRRTAFTSGYLLGPPRPVAAGTGTASSQEVRMGQKRLASRRQEEKEGTVAEVCGLPAIATSGALPSSRDSAALPHTPQRLSWQGNRPVPRPFAPAVAAQRTVAFLQTLSEMELEAVLAVDEETMHPQRTLHAALSAIIRQTRFREHLTVFINAPVTTAAEAEQLLEERVYHNQDRVFDGQLYCAGIRLRAVAALFEGDFFIGEQEDAHELFVALMARLETEAVDFQRRCAAMLEARVAQRFPRSPIEEEEEGKTRPGEEAAVNEGRMDDPDHCAVAPSLISTTVGDVWINTLVQLRLLNIIRCRSPGCGHAIVTDEVCVNLSVYIPEDVPPPPPLPSPSCASHHPVAVGDVDEVHMTEETPPNQVGEEEVGSGRDSHSDSPSRQSLPPPATAFGPCETPHLTHTCSVASLLHASMAYEPLKGYRCDVCGSSSSQYQGGCFYTRSPPLLVVQLKRFSTEFVDGMVRIMKNSRPVAVEDELVLYALPSATELQWLGAEGGGAASARLVTVADIAGETHGQLDPHAQQQTMVELVMPALKSTQETESNLGSHHFFYDAARKCFSTTPAALKQAENNAETVATHEEEEEPIDERTIVCAIRSVYRLQSCVLHLGQSLHYGHYVADFAVEGEALSSEEEEDENKEEEDQRTGTLGTRPLPADSTSASLAGSTHAATRTRRRWRRANDARVDVLPRSAVHLRRSGHPDMYLLLYEKVAEEWVRCPAEAVLPQPIYPTEAAETS